ncbi:MAG: hypothetical protein CFH40_00709, partial [Alphaproteobacteria bacterium MarineAlpha10_Bin3]
MGPKSRDLLAAISDNDVSNEVFPFSASRLINIGHGEV